MGRVIYSAIFEDPVMKSYMINASILALKILFMVPFIGRVQDPEDNALIRRGDKKGPSVSEQIEERERVRKIHINNIENIPIFWILGALYVTTLPSPLLAKNLFRIFTAMRLMYNFVTAVKPVPIPVRVLTFGIPYLILWYMGIHVIRHYMYFVGKNVAIHSSNSTSIGTI